MHIYTEALTSEGQRPPDPFPGLCSWTALENFCFPDPVALCPLT